MRSDGFTTPRGMLRNADPDGRLELVYELPELEIVARRPVKLVKRLIN